jgi:hypothetical protein
MDMPLYQQLQLSPPSPKPDQSSSIFYYYPCSPPFAAADASSFHLGYQLGSAAAAPAAVISSPELAMHASSMEQQPLVPKHDDSSSNAPGAGGAVSLDTASAQATTSRKDRHSKICTAGGMRDRRMRLSLDVARKFFALQDMLGFDKASKTVQWLLNTSKAAIQEIMTDDASSECVEDGSSSLSVDGKHNPATKELGGGDQKQKCSNGCSEGEKPAKPRRATATPKPPRKSANARPVLDKETRAKARERARDRTREKHRMRWVKLASAFDVEAAAVAGRDRPNATNLNHSPPMNMASAAVELKERCSSTLNNGKRTQEVSMASDPSDMILAFGNGGYGGSNYCQEQWELGGVVFPNSRFY